MTAQRCDWHVQPRPGTDVALVLGIICVLDRDGLVDAEHLGAVTSGWPELRAEAAALGLDDAAAITGIESADIVSLAHRIAQQRPTVLRVLIGMEHREHGQDIHRAVAALAAVSGSGYMRSTQAYFDTAFADVVPPPGPQRAVNMSALGEALCDAGLDPPVTVLVNYGCNPAAITPDQNRVLAGLERDDLFTVVIEQFMTDTARYADIVLPTTTQIEHLDLMNAWGHLYVLAEPAGDPAARRVPSQHRDLPTDCQRAVARRIRACRQRRTDGAGFAGERPPVARRHHLRTARARRLGTAGGTGRLVRDDRARGSVGAPAASLSSNASTGTASPWRTALPTCGRVPERRPGAR